MTAPQRRLPRMLAIVAALCTIAAAAGLVVMFASGGDQRYSAEIRRTEYGIPHILANDYGSLGYGYGYAFAQDNLCVMANRVVTLRGERSRYLGPTADSNDPFAGERATSNLVSDVFYQGVRDSGIVRRLLARPAPLGPTAHLRQLVDGYVAGYNRYLRDTGVAHLPDPTCRGKAWVGPITALDVWSGIYDLNQLEGAAQFREAIATASPPATGASAPRSAPSSPREQRAGTGSNGWAFGRDATRAHDGMLLANPHFPWAGHARFYQVQLTMPGVLNVSGASLAGTPVVEIGHTQGLAWTGTTSTAKRYTLYRLTLVRGRPTSYLVDGRAEPMTRQKVTVTVPGSGGTRSTVSRTLYGSRYGPVLATGWTNTTAFTIRDVNADNLRSTNEWLAIGKSQTIAQLRAAQDTYQGTPFSNTLAVDASGTAYFADASLVPHVTDAQAARCINTAQAKALYPDTFVLDGSTSACTWGSDPGAVERGIFAPSRVPRLTRTDYVANSNDSPRLTNPAAPTTGYSAIVGDTGSEPGLRTRLGLDMIARRRAGTDGLGPAGFTLRTLQATMLGNRNYSADLGRNDVVAMCRAHPILTASDGTRVDTRAACDTLARWDGRANAGSRGEALWEAFLRAGNLAALWLMPFDTRRPLAAPRGIKTNDPDVQRALADAAQLLQKRRNADGATRWAGIALPGCPGEIGCFNVIEASAVPTGPPPTSSSTNQSAPKNEIAQLLRYSACMRSHGLPTFPDPDATDGLGFTLAGSGLDPASAKFKSAEKACKSLLPAPRKTGPPSGPETGPSPDSRRQPSPSGKPSAIFGSSFIMAVELTPRGPRARTILTYSESANPASPHYGDQTVRFSRKQWVTERFTEAEINADPHLQTTTLQG